MTRTVAEIDKMIGEWESLRAEYIARGATGIVDFINAEIRKLRRDCETAQLAPPTPSAE